MQYVNTDTNNNVANKLIFFYIVRNAEFNLFDNNLNITANYNNYIYNFNTINEKNVFSGRRVILKRRIFYIY